MKFRLEMWLVIGSHGALWAALRTLAFTLSEMPNPWGIFEPRSDIICVLKELRSPVKKGLPVRG